MADSKECQYITKLSTYDVLCGRGSGPNEQEGNINFRDLVATRKAEYLGINPRDHKNKTRIAREIVDAVRSRGGRFLKRADVENVKGRPKPYELADEPAVLEKAKQALRQNRTGRVEPSAVPKPTTVHSESHTASMMNERATQPLPPTDPYGAFMVHLQQTSTQQPHGNGMSPAPPEAAMRNAQIQSFMAAQRQHTMIDQNLYFANAGPSGEPLGMVDPRNTMQQQYKAHQQQHHHPHPHAKPNNAISGQHQNRSVFGTAYGEADKKEYIRHGVAGRTTAAAAAAAASMRHVREQHCETSVAGIGSSGQSTYDAQMMAAAAASMRHARGQYYEASVANPGSSGHSPSDTRMIVDAAASIQDARKQHYEDSVYKAQQKQNHYSHAKPNSAISGQEQHISVFGVAYGEAAKSDYIRHQIGQQIMTNNMHSSSGFSGRTTAAAAASMRPSREQHCESSVASIGSFGHSIPDAQMIVDAATSMRHAREQHYENSVASTGSSGHSISGSQMMALEDFFLRASQKKSTRSNSRSQYQQSDSRPFHHQTRSTNSESFIDGLEDMSLPSMSLGEMSDFSALERASASRSKRSVGGTVTGSLPSMSLGEISDFSGKSRSKLSIGGTIIEGAEKDSSMDEASVGDSCDHHAKKPQEFAEGGSDGLPHTHGDREYDANRNSSCLGNVQNNSLDELASVASVMHSMSDDNPPPQVRPQEISHPSRTAIRNPGHQKRQKKSLSSYYREMKASSTTHDEAMSLDAPSTGGGSPPPITVSAATAERSLRNCGGERKVSSGLRRGLRFLGSSVDIPSCRRGS